MVDLHGILEPDFLQKAEGNCKVLVISQLSYMHFIYVMVKGTVWLYLVYVWLYFYGFFHANYKILLLQNQIFEFFNKIYKSWSLLVQ